MVHNEAESGLFKGSWCSSWAHWGSIPKNPVVISWGNFAGDFLNKSVDFKRKKYINKLASFHELMGNLTYFLQQCFHYDGNGGGLETTATSARWSSTTWTRPKKALFPKPQSIDRSRIRYTCPLLHCDSKQRPKPPDVNSHRNATRQILQ